jgi:hypothetical protein
MLGAPNLLRQEITVLRFFAGVAVCFLLMTGAFLLWQSRAEHAAGVPQPSGARSAGGFSFFGSDDSLQAPEATEKTREQKRFSRYDKNKDGKVQIDEYLAARRKNFDKLDLDHNGQLAFQEYAAKAIDKFNAAGGRKGFLTEAEFATTAPPRSKKRRTSCSCRAPAPQPEFEPAPTDDNNG